MNRENEIQIFVVFNGTMDVKIMSRHLAKTAVIVSHIGFSEVICSLHGANALQPQLFYQTIL